MDAKDRTRQKRRGVFFKQYVEELNVTQTEFTDQINRVIVRSDFYLPDSKKISDWKSNGIPGPGTSMKARIRQLAIIRVLGIEQNSDDHKMLDGRMDIPHGVLDSDDKTNKDLESTDIDQERIFGDQIDTASVNPANHPLTQSQQSTNGKSEGSWLYSISHKLGIAPKFLRIIVASTIGLGFMSGYHFLARSGKLSPDQTSVSNVASANTAQKHTGFVGKYQVQGVNPGGNGNYVGTVVVEKSKQTYIVLWNIAGQEHIGIGTSKSDSATTILKSGAHEESAIAIAFKTNNAPGVAFFSQQADGSWKGKWTGWGVVGYGTEHWTRK